MSKADKIDQEAIENTEAEQQFHFGPGALLKQAREQQNISQEQISERLKLMPQTIQEIEADDYQSTTPSAFYRGYIHNYAQLLGLDAGEFTENYARFVGAEALTSAPKQNFSNVSFKQPVNSKNWIMKIVSVAVILAVLYALYYLFAEYKVLDKWRSSEKSGDTTLNSEPNLGLEADELALSFDTENAESSSQPLTLDAADSEAVDSDSGEVAIEPEIADNELELSSAESTATEEDTLPSTQEVQASAAALNMSFSADCWVKVTDATGQVLALGIKQQGHHFALNGTAPYDIILGNPAGVSIEFEGRAVDLSAYPADRTAKLTLGN